MSVSINDFFKCPFTLDRLHNCGYLSEYLDSFADWLAGHHYADFTIRKHVSHVAHLSRSLGTMPDLKHLPDLIHIFLSRHIPTCKCKGWKHPRYLKAISSSLNRFKDYLIDCHGIDFDPRNSAHDQIHHAYLFWLSGKGQLADSSIRSRSRYLKQFLEWHRRSLHCQSLANLRPLDVESFFIEATSRRGKSFKRSLQVTLRSFFDFCYEEGHIKQNLRFSLPVIRMYRLAEVPRKIDDHEAIKLIDSIDRSTNSGKRTFAMLRILHTYGVRGCQLRALKLNDINWHSEEIGFPAVKDGKSCSFPLTGEVGNALLDYLQNVRKTCRYQEVFLTLRAPYIPLTKSNALSQIIRTAMIGANIRSPSKGAHCFRHGIVSRMLKQGESFKHIADLVGHKHIQTTFIYTKIDFDSLASVPLELPEVAYENH